MEIGVIVEFEYHGSPRRGEVVKVAHWGVTVKTAEGYRSFKWEKMVGWIVVCSAV